MQKQERYRVLPMLQEWVVRRERDGQIMSTHRSKESAESAASDLAAISNGTVVQQTSQPHDIYRPHQSAT